MNLTLHVWRQKSRDTEGRLVEYKAENISPDASFLEMLDVVNERPHREGRGADPLRARLPRRHLRLVRHDDQRRRPRPRSAAPPPASSTCATSATARRWLSNRGAPAPSRSSKTSSSTAPPSTRSSRPAATSPSTPAAPSKPTPSPSPSRSRNWPWTPPSASSAAPASPQCPNGAAQLFTAAKVSHLGLLPQGQPERYERVVKMVEVMESYFGSCTLFRECEAVCPKEISVSFIARMNRDYLVAKSRSR